MIELIFAMTILGIVLLSVPQLLTTTLESMTFANKQKEIDTTQKVLLHKLYTMPQNVTLSNYTPNSKKVLTITNITFQTVEEHGVKLSAFKPIITRRELHTISKVLY
jgi:Tfp pilus assembly protein PilV